MNILFFPQFFIAKCWDNILVNAWPEANWTTIISKKTLELNMLLLSLTKFSFAFKKREKTSSIYPPVEKWKYLLTSRGIITQSDSVVRWKRAQKDRLITSQSIVCERRWTISSSSRNLTRILMYCTADPHPTIYYWNIIVWERVFSLT